MFDPVTPLLTLGGAGVARLVSRKEVEAEGGESADSGTCTNRGACNSVFPKSCGFSCTNSPVEFSTPLGAT